jgi:hypothetical protein
MTEWPNIEQAAVSTLLASLLLAKNTDEIVSDDMVSTGTGVVGDDNIRKERISGNSLCRMQQKQPTDLGLLTENVSGGSDYSERN